MFDKKKILKIRKEFPIFKKKINNYPFIYFDNASTTHKPKILIKKLKYYYFNLNSNIRNNTFLSFKNFYYIKKCRKEIKKFINAKEYKEIIFTKNTTESINLISKSLNFLFNKNDEIIITQLEHHSNIIPWQILSFKKKLKLKILKINKKFNISLKRLKLILTKKTKLISLTHISNVFGTILPIKKIVEIIKNYNKNIIIILDGAQSISHLKINVQKLNVDFYVFSAHKIYGPTGLGILYGKKKILNKMSCYQYGGGMIKKYNYKKSLFLKIPNKFEAGTLNLSSIFSFLYIIKFINKININNINKYENIITNYLIKLFLKNKNIILYNKNYYSPIISFNIKNINNYDIGNLLNNYGISVRTGYHCTNHLFKYLKLNGTIRISFGIYNNIEEINKFYFFLLKIIKLLY